MNFLAHLYLADPTPASMIGNLLPDLVPGPLNRGVQAQLRTGVDSRLHTVGHRGEHRGGSPGLDPGVLAGAINHKRVDAFTDTHPVFARSRARLRPRHGRYSAILTDMFYDHVLAKHWNRYHDQPLDEFIDRAYTAMSEHTHLMPEPMAAITGRMIEQDWLRSYSTADGMRRILTMMSVRFSERLARSVELEHAVEDLQRHGDDFTDDFHEFFPELTDYVRRVKSQAGTERLVH